MATARRTARTMTRIVVVAAVLGAAGCAAGNADGSRPSAVPVATTVSTATATATATPDVVAVEPAPPTVTAVPTALPKFESLVVSTAGVGTLGVGDPVPATPSSADLITWDPVECAGTDNPGRWRGVYPDLSSTPFTRPVDVWVDGGKVRQISIGVAGAHTARGIQVGSTLASLRAAYPAARLYDRNSLGEVVPLEPGAAQSWVVTDANGTLVFEVGGTSPALWTPEMIGRVLLIRVVSSDDPTARVATWGLDAICG